MLIPECDPAQCRIQVIEEPWPINALSGQFPLRLQHLRIGLEKSEIVRLLLLPAQIFRVEFADRRVLEFHVVDRRDDLWREVLSKLQDGSLGTFVRDYYTLNASDLYELEGSRYQHAMLSICNRCATLGDDAIVRSYERGGIRLWVVNLQGDPRWEHQFALLSNDRDGLFIQGFSSGFEFDDLMQVLSTIE